MTSQAPAGPSKLPKLATETPLKRDDWMLEGLSKADDDGADLFTGMGQTKVKTRPEKRDPDKVWRSHSVVFVLMIMAFRL